MSTSASHTFLILRRQDLLSAQRIGSLHPIEREIHARTVRWVYTTHVLLNCVVLDSAFPALGFSICKMGMFIVSPAWRCLLSRVYTVLKKKR